MKISTIKTYIVPSHISDSSWSRGKAWLLVKIETDANIDGWGEAYVPHDCEIVIAAFIQSLSRYIEGTDPFRIKHFRTNAIHAFAQMQTGFHLSCAISGIEIALWDIVGKALNKPVHQLLGGHCRDRIKVYANCFSHIDRTPEEVTAYALEQVDQGFRTVKIYPFLNTHNISQGIECVEMMRNALGPTIDILVDLWRIVDSSILPPIIECLNRAGVKWIEDPCAPENIAQLTNIRKKANQSVVTGETFSSKLQFRSLLENNAADVLNPDITCCGIIELREIAAMAEPYFVNLAIHNFNTMAVGLAASLHVGSVVPNLSLVEHFPRFEAPSRLFSNSDWQVEQDGCIALPTEAGLGVSINESSLVNFEYQASPIRDWPDH